MFKWITHTHNNNLFMTNYELLEAKHIVSYLKCQLNSFQKIRAHFHFERISVHDEISEIYERKVSKIILVIWYLSMTSIRFEVRIKLPTINKYLLFWTINWRHGKRSGNGSLSFMSAVLHLWRHCPEGPQKITCNIKRDNTAWTQNWWNDGRCRIRFFNIGSLVLYDDVGPLCAKWMLPAPSSERLFANNQELQCAPFAELLVSTLFCGVCAR